MPKLMDETQFLPKRRQASIKAKAKPPATRRQRLATQLAGLFS